jgi:drug/metabolite transporter (DMT)-like permease
MTDVSTLVPVLFGLGAGLTYSLSHFFARLGLETSNPTSAVFMNVAVSSIGLWILAAALSPVQPIVSWSAWPFVVAGFLSPTLARTLLYRGVTHLGLARSSVLVGTVPLFSVVIAVIILGERPSAVMVGGVAFILVGVGALHYSRAEGQTWATWTLLLPLGAALCFGLVGIFSKVGMQRIPLPLPGAAVMATTSLCIFLISLSLSRNQRAINLSGRSFWFFAAGSLFMLTSYAFMFFGLRAGMVSLVSPLMAINPLFSVLLAYVFLQKDERVTFKVVAGGVLIVAGALGVILGRT